MGNIQALIFLRLNLVSLNALFFYIFMVCFSKTSKSAMIQMITYI